MLRFCLFVTGVAPWRWLCHPGGAPWPKLAHFVPTMSENRRAPPRPSTWRALRYRLLRGQRSTHPGFPQVARPGPMPIHSDTFTGHLCARHSGYTAVPGGNPTSQSPCADEGHTQAAALATDGHTGSQATSGSPGSGRPSPVKAELEMVLACSSLGRTRPASPGGGLGTAGTAHSGFIFGEGALAARLSVCL